MRACNRPSPLLLLLAVVAAAAAPLAAGVPPADAPQVSRVFYLDRIDPATALRELRVQVGIAHVAVLEEPRALVVRDLAAQVDRAEAVLSELGGFERAVEPHPPIASQRPPEAELVERELRFRGDHAKTGKILLRSLYGVKTIVETADPAGLTIRDTEAIVDAIEALLGELGLLERQGERSARD